MRIALTNPPKITDDGDISIPASVDGKNDQIEMSRHDAEQLAEALLRHFANDDKISGGSNGAT
jgi:hypothetical protein